MSDTDDLIPAAAPVLRNLSNASNRTAQLAVFDEGYAVYVDQVTKAQPVKPIHLGSRAPASVVSTGKVLLAWLPHTALEQALPLVKAFTSKTITDHGKIAAELAHVKERGYAENKGEYHENVGGFAAPVFSKVGKIIAAVGTCPQPFAEVTEAEREKLIRLTVESARTISTALGYRGEA